MNGMIIISGVVTLLIFMYLVYALFKPENLA